ncbi:Hypothetical predicted protein [Pelobates cultripes]|uniref:Uncharacterized protein n=1 Tax=Pelobates cultripes TaxID=61616 RepID=A0AAD1WLN2_PELCU|nr:Hypothetical predicted protein [Pelobates cultripes]
MEETEVNASDDSSSEGSIQTERAAEPTKVDDLSSVSGRIPLDIVNGEGSSRDPPLDGLKMNLNPEDLINNNKGAIEQGRLTVQKVAEKEDKFALVIGKPSSPTMSLEDGKILIHQASSRKHTEEAEGEHFNTKSVEMDKDYDTTLSMESQRRHLIESFKAPDFLEDLHNDVHFSNSSKATVIEDYRIQGEPKSDKPKAASSMSGLDLLVNGSSTQGEVAVRSFSPDLPTKVTNRRLQKNQSDSDYEKVKGRKWDEPLLGKRSVLIDDISLISEDLDPVMEENIFDDEEGNDADNLDHFIHYRSSDDRLDPRKERHQYVSDKLDPDVLQLLEMHLRKQQLVDIKEEGEEELLDLHINKEKTRTESFKSLRNIAPVLDIVLEEPEQEHLGDTFEEDSKPPSDIDSDDSSNICALEMGLMESLQNDLISKTSKIDKDEMATILQKASPDLLLEHSNKPNASSEHNDKPRNTCNVNIETKEQYTQVPEISVSNELQINVCHLDDRDIKSDIISERNPDGRVDTINIQLEHSTKSALKLTEQTVLPDDRNLISETGWMEDVLPSCKQSINGKVNLSSYVPHTKTHQPDHISVGVDMGFNLHQRDPRVEKKSDVSNLSRTGSQDLGKMKVATCADGSCLLNKDNVKLPSGSQPYVVDDKEEVSILNSGKNLSDQVPCKDSDFDSENPSLALQGGVKGSSGIAKTNSTDDHAHVKVQAKPRVENDPSGETFDIHDEGDTLHINLEKKILSLLEKAHAADCRSSHLQVEAEHLWKESLKLRNACQSLTSEAAELLSIFSQQRVGHRHTVEQSADKHAQEVRGRGPNNTKQRKKEALNFSINTNTEQVNSKRLKGEDQVQQLCKKYNFLRQEAPEVMRELNSLQEDLKSLPQLQSKPVRILYNMLWGGLITGGAMLLAWWSTKQLG